MLSAHEQMKIITKGAHQVVSPQDLLAKLEASIEQNNPLIIKLGLDPSAPDIHVGHTVVLRKMKQMQDLGHKVIIVIGDFTGKIGDPTGKAKGRVALTDQQVKANAETYCKQIFKVLDPSKTEVRFNSEWLAKLNFEEILQMASILTVARMLERDDFQKRYQNQTPIGIHEFFYPLMQAYDSIALNADFELGGTDQTFNILMGRTMQKAFGKTQQVAMFMPILEGLDGVEKMSKSLGNYIGIDEPAEVMFKKVMEVPDALIMRYFELVTDLHPDEINRLDTALKSGVNPKEIKLILAREITGYYHSANALEEAEKFFHQAFSKKSIPDQLPEITIDSGSTLQGIIHTLIELDFIKSRSAFLRLLDQGGIQINSNKIDKNHLMLPLEDQDVIKIGKKTFVKLVLPRT